jgi:hypothetical protein
MACRGILTWLIYLGVRGVGVRLDGVRGSRPAVVARHRQPLTVLCFDQHLRVPLPAASLRSCGGGPRALLAQPLLLRAVVRHRRRPR